MCIVYTCSINNIINECIESVYGRKIIIINSYHRSVDYLQVFVFVRLRLDKSFIIKPK